MQYTTLGHTGLVVSRLAFGAMTFGEGQLVPGVTNNIDQNMADQMVNRALDAGIGILVWSPLASGFLSGKYSRETPVPEDARRHKFQFPPIEVEKGYEVVDLLKEIGQNHGASPAQVAIAWILTKPFISSVIIGANKMAQLEDNLGAADLKLSPHEVEKLDSLTAPQPLYPGWMQAMGWDAQVKAALDP